jgi:hypothetical protein
MVIESRAGKWEKRCASLALRQQGQQLKDRARSRSEREADNTVTVASRIPVLASQAYKSVRGSEGKIVGVKTANTHGAKGKDEPRCNSGVKGGAASSDRAGERDVSQSGR